MNYPDAKVIATRLVEQMRPYCERIEIAGSLRRRKPDVRDLEIVCIPKYEEVTNTVGLFGETQTTRVNMLHQWATSSPDGVEWIKSGTDEIIPWHVKPDGKYWRAMIDSKIKLDLFITTPECWGCIFLIRTGCAQFSHRLATYAQEKGFRLSEGRLYNPRGICLETPEEKDVFAALGLQFVLPHERWTPANVAKIGQRIIGQKESQ